MSDGGIPDSPAGRRLAWYLGRLASAGEGASDADAACLAPRFIIRAPFPAPGEDLHEGWRRASSRLGTFKVVSIEQASDLAITLRLDGADGKKWRLLCEVEEREPHRIAVLQCERILDVDLVVREATEADATALADIERRCPIVLGDASMTIDRGDDYFAFTRLMEEFIVAIGFVDGKLAGVNCGGIHSVRVGGVERRIMAAVHLRILPEHQKKGLWGAISQVFDHRYPPGALDGSTAYVSVENTAMQRGFATTPNKWSVYTQRAQLSCASLAGPPIGRPATPRDVPRIVEILNACHGAEEMYLPYTVESFTARMERSPKQYSWGRVWVTDRAAVGIWALGETARYITESKGRRTESRRGLALDYGFLPGAEDQFEGLVRAWCGWLSGRGLDTLSIFTSAASPGYARLRDLAREIESFILWTPGIPVPEGASTRGLYVDPVYF